eukprot:scaffold201442_cov37-Prasinocladus_malaysianus.AAC.1
MQGRRGSEGHYEDCWEFFAMVRITDTCTLPSTLVIPLGRAKGCWCRRDRNPVCALSARKSNKTNELALGVG